MGGKSSKNDGGGTVGKEDKANEGNKKGQAEAKPTDFVATGPKEVKGSEATSASVNQDPPMPKQAVVPEKKKKPMAQPIVISPKSKPEEKPVEMTDENLEDPRLSLLVHDGALLVDSSLIPSSPKENYDEWKQQRERTMTQPAEANTTSSPVNKQWQAEHLGATYQKELVSPTMYGGRQRGFDNEKFRKYNTYNSPKNEEAKAEAQQQRGSGKGLVPESNASTTASSPSGSVDNVTPFGVTRMGSELGGAGRVSPVRPLEEKRGSLQMEDLDFDEAQLFESGGGGGGNNNHNSTFGSTVAATGGSGYNTPSRGTVGASGAGLGVTSGGIWNTPPKSMRTPQGGGGAADIGDDALFDDVDEAMMNDILLDEDIVL